MPDIILSSDAVRARSTAEAVAQTLGYPRDIVLDPSLYHATPAAVLEAVNGVDDQAGTVLVVGHNPGLEDVVRRLTGEYHSLGTAALVELELPIDRWRDLEIPIAASIVGIRHPRDDD